MSHVSLEQNLHLLTANFDNSDQRIGDGRQKLVRHRYHILLYYPSALFISELSTSVE